MVGPKERRVSLLCVLAAAVAGCGHAPTLDELTSVDQLKERFNRDASATRIVLLLTPT